MDLILLDWTRIGKGYCLAGVIVQNNQYWVVRPLPPEVSTTPARNLGWSNRQMDGHSRWEIFEMVDPQPAGPQPPHLEDVLVRELKPRCFVASPAERQAILHATLTPPGQSIFGQQPQGPPTGTWLMPGMGSRSLAGVTVPAGSIAFSCEPRLGREEPAYRVSLDLPNVGRLNLPLKDHFLLLRAELAGNTPEGRLAALSWFVRQMGDPVVVRLGLSRPFPAAGQVGEGVCWLMANGFFSLQDPQL